MSDFEPDSTRAVLFDVGGTLTITGPVVTIAARALGVPTDSDTVEDLARAIKELRPVYESGGTDERYWQLISDVVGGPELTNTDVQRLIQAEMDRWTRPPATVLRLVRELDGHGVPMGVLSNTPLTLARNFDNLAWAEPFRVRRFACFTGQAKPSREAFDGAANALGRDAKDVVYFDDRQINIDAGKNRGMDAHMWHGAEAAREVLADRGLLPKE